MALVINAKRSSSLAWLAVPLCAFGFLVWLNVVRIQHVEYVTAQGGWGEKPPGAGAVAGAFTSELATGNGLIIPGHFTESFHWIAQTQRMLNRGEWRVRHIDYENAPFGRAVNSPSPYRWWLGLIAWCDHAISGRAPAQSVERAALVADPLLQLLFLLGTTLLVAWRFGSISAALVSMGGVAIFPLAAEFLPGAPDDHGLAHLVAMSSVLLLLAGVSRTPALTGDEKSLRRWFFLAGVTGGLGLWLSVSAEGPVLAGVFVSAWLAAWVARNRGPADVAVPALLPWRVWAIGGAIATLAGYLMEFAPSHLGDWRLSTIHPLYGLAWLGGGEILAQTTEWIQGRKIQRSLGIITRLVQAALAIGALPLAMWKLSDSGIFSPDLLSARLSKLPDGVVAESLGAWILRDEKALPLLATLLPVLMIVPALWLLGRRATGVVSRVAIAMTLGPVLLALGFACYRLIWWSEADGLLLVVLVAVIAGLQGAKSRQFSSVVSTVLVLLLFLPGLFLLTPRATVGSDFSRAEVFGLVERDLAVWLALHADPAGAVILAPPNESTALCYYGGMRGIGTLSWENKDGVAAAVRILSAPSAQEAKELIEGREITHLVILSWDSYFDEYARAGTGQLEGSFHNELRTWKLPPWLRPVAYQLPTIAGFEGQSATIFEVVEEQNEATALGRLAEYFIEMGELDRAAATAQALRRFPADIGAWVVRAEVELARGEETAFATSLKLLQTRFAAKTAPVLPWDIRVGLSVVFAKAKQAKLAHEQLSVCVAAADEGKLRALSTGALYRLLVLSRANDLQIDPKLRQFALELLPVDLRDRLR